MSRYDYGCTCGGIEGSDPKWCDFCIAQATDRMRRAPVSIEFRKPTDETILDTLNRKGEIQASIAGRKPSEPNIQFIRPPLTPDMQQMMDDIKAAMAEVVGFPIFRENKND